MATFFQSFRSSNMPKRLLRYALSRLELLEEESLDMDNLDFALGRNTTFEFKDVGVRLKKLERLLKLPPTFKLQRAKVLKLTVTIPMDFYTSPIIIEIDGVDVRIHVSGEDDDKTKSSRSGTTSMQPEIVPHTHDLAASFLETQPQAEKRKLEEALAAETHHLGASVSMSDSSTSEDDDPAFGTGQPLSLPAFLGDFLQGIVDRTQVRIRGVTFQLDVDVALEANSAATDVVAFQIALNHVDVEGVTAEMMNDKGESSLQPKEGKRHIALSQIKACLITEASVFSTFARSPSVSSPAMSRVASFAERTHSPSPVPAESNPLAQSLDLSDSVELDEADEALLCDSEDALEIPYELPADPEEEEEEEEEEETTHTPRASIYQDTPAPEASYFSPRRAVDGDDLLLTDTNAPPEALNLADSTSTLPSEVGEARLARRLSSASQDSEPGESDDLAQSQLFTHEEAESMYLSAFSQADSQRLGSSMPGAWDEGGEQPTARAIRPHDDQGYNVANAIGDEPRAPSPVSGDALKTSRPEEPFSPTESTHEEQMSSPGSPVQVGDALENDTTEPPKDLPGTSQDDVPTPRGPTRLVKEIISLDRISIYVPSMHEHLHVRTDPISNESLATSPRLASSVAPQIPGAFSVYSSMSTHEATVRSRPSTGSSNVIADDVVDNSLEVNLTPIEVQFDASIAFLLATVGGKLFNALKGASEPEGNTAKTEERPATAAPDMKVVVEKLSLLFVNQLCGVADTAERSFGPASMQMQPDILLQTIFDKVVVSTKHDKSIVETSIDVEKFKLGYAKDDIISFDQSLQMRTSVMDKFPSAGADISVRVTQSPHSTRSDITTLPLLVQVDLQKLDETFSWFGGLSSFLNMSASMTSSTSAFVKSPVQSARKPRGVRFDTPINPDDRSAASENKVDMRIGGFNLELRGRDCSVGLETSAVKMVSRESGIGFAISKARVAGPYLKYSRGEAPVTVDLGGLRFEYCNTPTDRDLESLLELIIPSKLKFDTGDNEIMVDTLLRQRRKGPILRITIDQLLAKVNRLAQLQCLPGLGEELARLGSVARYLPEDDRPGLLVLAKVLDTQASLDIGGKIGVVYGDFKNFEVAHISVPSLLALGVGSISINRNRREDLVSSPDPSTSQGPVLMVRMIGDEMEPAVKLKLRDVLFDYRVPTIMDVLGLSTEATPQEFEASLAASVAHLGDQAHTALGPKPPSARRGRDSAKAKSKPVKVDVLFKDCLLGLNPMDKSSKLIISLVDADLEITLSQDIETHATLHLHKSDILLTDDVSRVEDKDASNSRRSPQASSEQVAELLAKGFVSICYISAAKIVVDVIPNPVDGETQVDVELHDDLLVIETCADSTQTLIALANALTPPTPPSKENKYRTNVVPMQDLLASISPEAFGRAEGEYDFDQDFPMAQGVDSDDEYEFALGSGSSPEEMPDRERETVAEALFSAGASIMSGVSVKSDNVAGSSDASDDSSDLAIDENYFSKKEDLDSKARIWNSKNNTYDRAPADSIRRSTLRVSVRDVHVIWNLFDGYDWATTRNEISKTVEEVENKALERRRRQQAGTVEDDDDDDMAVIGDYLFNSIYIGIPANRDPRDLAQMINEDLNDNATFTETESIAATSVTATPSRPGTSHRPKRKLRLKRSRRHKITFELSGVNVDLIVFPANSGETQSSVDVRIHDLTVFDHIPTSTWKKFATYDKDAGDREMNTSMARIELLNVKPHADLAAAEIVLRVTVLPLRLHVDQDALDFITRFFEFKDDKVPVHSSPSDVPFLQRAEVMDIPVQLDFKPKRIDYAGLKSGRTTEFMNFIILDQARMTLRHTIIYGISGFDRMGKTLNDIWMPDVKRTQLPGVLAGLAPIRGLVNIGSGFKDLVEIPVKEYQKDGRIFRSLRMGATAFARTTGTEMVKLGAKVAIGTQTALQSAEGLLSAKPVANGEATSWDGDDPSDAEEQQKQISLYADQPTGVIQGLRGGYASLARDLHLARDAIIAVPGEVMESQNAQGLAKVMLNRAPTIVFRPAIGASKAIGKTLLGATNALDPQNRRRVEDKYKRH